MPENVVDMLYRLKSPSMSVADHSMPAISFPRKFRNEPAEELSGFFTATP
jgi:hypothetical protein